ncbi:hypothetical protein HK098_007611 [Nowakowskiella sp. JEL0407]|nr:hypothetical protein HK098_007611 [Nowakowskiella sp. JEL0407]
MFQTLSKKLSAAVQKPLTDDSFDPSIENSEAAFVAFDSSFEQPDQTSTTSANSPTPDSQSALTAASSSFASLFSASTSPKLPARKISGRLNFFTQPSQQPIDSTSQPLEDPEPHTRKDSQTMSLDIFRDLIPLSSGKDSNFEEIKPDLKPINQTGNARQRLEALVKKRGSGSSVSSSDPSLSIPNNFNTQQNLLNGNSKSDPQDELIQLEVSLTEEISLRSVQSNPQILSNFSSAFSSDSGTPAIIDVETEAVPVPSLPRRTRGSVSTIRSVSDHESNHENGTGDTTTTTTTTMENSGLSLLTPQEMQQEILRLKKLESRYGELGRAYKVLQKKSTGIENVIKQVSPFEAIKSPADIEALHQYFISQKTKNEETENEIKQLNRRINELKEVTELEVKTKTELFDSLQIDLEERDEQIKHLKESLEILPTSSTPDNPPPSEDIHTLYKKLQEVSTVLRKTIDQRNKALEQIKQLNTSPPAANNDEIDTLKTKISELESTIDTLKAVVSAKENSTAATSLKSELENVELKEMEDKFTTARKEFDEEKRRFELELKEKSEKLKTAQDENSALLKKLVGLEVITNQKTMNDESDKESKVLSDRVLQLENELAAANAAAEKFQRIADKQTTQIESLETSVTENQSEILSLNASIDNLQTSKDELSVRLTEKIEECEKLTDRAKLLQSEKETQLSELQEKLITLTQQNDELLQSVTTKSTQIEHLESQLTATAQQRSQQSSDESMTLNSRITILEANLQSLTIENEKLLQTNTSLTNEITQLNSQITEFRQVTQSEDTTTLRTQITDLEHQLSIATSKITDQQHEQQNGSSPTLSRSPSSESSFVKSRVAELESIITTLKEEKETILKSINAKNLEGGGESGGEREHQDALEINGVKAKVAELELEVLKLKSENLEVLAEVDAKNLEVVKLVEEVETLKTLNSKLQESVTDTTGSQQKLTELQTEIESLTKEKEELKEAIVNKDTEIARLSEELNGLSEDKRIATVQIDQASKRIEELVAELQKLDEDVLKLKQEDLGLSERVRELEGEVIKCEAVIVGLKEEKEVLVKRHEEEVLMVKSELSEKSEKLKEEEEKKSRSIQLLRSSKTRILKLEADLTASQSETQKFTESNTHLTTQLSQKESQIVSLTQKLDTLTQTFEQYQHQSTIDESEKAQLIADVAELEDKVSELSQEINYVKAERDSLADTLQAKHTELETLQATVQQHGAQLQVWPSRVAEAEERVHLLEQELTATKKVGQVKSMESEQFKLKVVELEAQVYKFEEKLEAGREDLERAKIESEEAMKLVLVKEEEVAKRVKELEEYKSLVKAKENEIQGVKEALEKESSKVKQVQSSMEDEKEKRAELELKIQTELSKYQELEAKFNSVTEELQKSIKEQTAIMEETKMREGQLRNVNKALKDEVRKLSKSNLLSTNSPSSSRHSVASPTSNTSSPAKPTAVGFSTRSASLQTLSTISAKAPMKPSPLMLNTSPEESMSSVGSVAPVAASSPVSNQHGEKEKEKEKELPENQEYLRFIILKYLESRDNRKQLIGVLAKLLHFTDEERKNAEKAL